MKVFDAEKFRVKMESLLGGQYVSRLVEITGTNRTTVRRWVVKSPDNPQKGPSPKFQDIISKKIKEEFGISIMWREFMNPLIDEEEQKLDDSIFKPDAFDPYEELLIAKKKINDLTNTLYLKDQEIIKLRSLLNKKEIIY